jgi:hypothetical protein
MKLLALGLCSWMPAALAQTPCQPTGGPDLVVSDVNQVANYTSAGSLEALALGKVYCNVGATWCNCSANTNQHPLAAPGLFRLKTVAGAQRFEQVGTGWVFHSFLALSNSNCCNDCQATDGTHVGVHCSDTNTASSSGTQSTLGPRWQVDAFTGAFAYPPANPGFSGSTARRLEVELADLEPTGGTNAARYFGEVLMLAPDEALAGNGSNNASYRELSVSGSGSAWNFAFLGATAREAPAILAWQLADPAVQVAQVQVPGEGRLYLAWKTTALGNGVFHYEYALYNLDSDDAVGSFSLPIAPGASATNPGFHDVTYRNGDGIGNVDQDGTDWPATLAGGLLSWSTDAFALHPNANALRWGTLYNFRFDSDCAPGPGTITLGLFKTGGSVGVSADVPRPPGTPTCFGDGTQALPCPCSNSGTAGHGCQNSAGTGGALLGATGATNPDTLVLHSSGELPTALTIFLQGNQLIAPLPFGDGLRCAGGALKRLYVESASGGSASAPQLGDPSVSQQSANLGDPILPGSSRWYQAYYRDSNATFCPIPQGNTYNISNAVQVDW